MKKIVLRLLREEDGPTAVEYAVMLSLILMACFAAIAVVGQTAGGSFTNSGGQIANAMAGS